MRQLIGDQRCRKNALAIAGNNYKGLAVGTLEQTMLSGAREVVDSPEGNFPGHADVISIAPNPLDEDPHPPEVMKQLVDYYDAMVKHFTYFEDPDRKADRWTGPSLARSA
jgi:hypothetical protein